MSPRLLIALVAGIFTALCAMFAVALLRPDPEQLPSAYIGLAAPALTVTRLNTVDTPLTSEDDVKADHVKLVNFWASWCAPCRAEHPNLTAIAGAGIPVHGINYKDKSHHAARFLAELGNPFATLAADAAGRTGLDWGLYGVPETFVIDDDGKIVLRHAGPITWRVMESKILPALGADASAAIKRPDQ